MRETKAHRVEKETHRLRTRRASKPCRRGTEEGEGAQTTERQGRRHERAIGGTIGTTRRDKGTKKKDNRLSREMSSRGSKGAQNKKKKKSY